MTPPRVVSQSPFRRVDPRAKVLMALLFSFAAFPLSRTGLLSLSVAMASLIVFGRLSGAMWRGLRRSLIPLAVLFVINYFAASTRARGEERRDNAEAKPPAAAASTRPAEGGDSRDSGRGSGRGDGGGRRRRAENRNANERTQPGPAPAVKEGRESTLTKVEPTSRSRHLAKLAKASEIVLRIVTAASAFFLLTLTTTPEELCNALSWYRLPYRFAFAIALAFRHVSLTIEQLRLVRESHRLRGLSLAPSSRSPKALLAWARSSAGLLVPVFVMTTRRAWEITEAASARGFDSPDRSVRRKLRFKATDLAVGAVCVLFLVSLFHFGQ